MTMPEEFLTLARKLNNWGRFGKDDEIGTLNFVTPNVVREAARCIKKGSRFSLAIPLSMNGPQTGAIPGRVNPVRTMTAVNLPITKDPSSFCMNDDAVFMGLQAATHWDSLAHVSYDGRIYNGFGASSVDARGARKCGIDKVRSLTTRGVLLDVARALGLEKLEPGYAITPEDLQKAESHARTTVRSGDVALVRTGQIQLLHDGDKHAYANPSPGLSMLTPEWFFEREVAAVATDNLTFDVYPCEKEDIPFPAHLLHLVEMGLTQGQNFDLESLAEDCAEDGVYEFFLEASPQPFVNGLGSPVNPVAIK
ncbi:MAG: cyclase family protein [Actinomycetota bacterium]